MRNCDFNDIGTIHCAVENAVYNKAHKVYTKAFIRTHMINEENNMGFIALWENGNVVVTAYYRYEVNSADVEIIWENETEEIEIYL